eukprot:Hpha_TRINITY_DN11910_c0_g1::TRINITY_DN11910_c0_g1_i1::g.20895::m.20895
MPRPTGDLVAQGFIPFASADATTSAVTSLHRIFRTPSCWVVQWPTVRKKGRAESSPPAEVIRVDTPERKSDGSLTVFAYTESGQAIKIVSTGSGAKNRIVLHYEKGPPWNANTVQPLFIEWQRERAGTGGRMVQHWMRHRIEIHRAIPVANGKFQLRVGRETDAGGCLKLERDLLAAHRQLSGWEKLNDDALYQFVFAVDNDGTERRRAWESHLGPKKTDWFTFVLEGPDGTLGGMIHYQVPVSSFAMIYRLSVAPELRNQGLGTLLLRHVLAMHGSREIRIQVLIPAAERLYRRCGFHFEVDTMEVQCSTMVTLSTRPAPPPGDTDRDSDSESSSSQPPVSAQEARRVRVPLHIPVRRRQVVTPPPSSSDRKRQRV